jgi:hypothetical protein
MAAQTFPFRVRGMQVRVMNEAGQPASKALVYRLPGGQPIGGPETPFRTSPSGYLIGRGDLNPGDHLMALWPVSQSTKYTLYHTSAVITDTEPSLFTVSQSGVQTLTVSADDPLLLFDLTVSLEWDASKDAAFLTLLKQNLAKTSVALYDWSNGQVALGRVTVYQDKEKWDEADIHIFASNQIRPMANRGGIVLTPTVLTGTGLTGLITATPGEIRLGPAWNRYGDPQPLGDDWPRVLAHEISHYALFLEDTYLKLNENGLLIPSGCEGTAMSNPYDDNSSEFSYETGCTSLAELPDWNLLTLAFPALHSPLPANDGPAAIPFAFTQIEIKAAPAQSQPLLDNFEIELPDALSNGRAYLRQPGQHLIDLGGPALNAVLARGAREGDELCVFSATAFGCAPLRNSGPPHFEARTVWLPEITLTPIDTTTLQLLVIATDEGPLSATLYPQGEIEATVNLTSGEPQIVTLNQPALEVLVDIAGDEPGERLMTGYATGAGPGSRKGHGGPGSRKGHGGPFTSGDGSVLISPPENISESTFIVLQTATSLPELPAGLTVIGRAYHVRSSAAFSNFSGGSLTFQYLGLQVLLSQKPEASLAVYFWNGTTWTQLETELDQTQNFASAPLPGPGLYVLTAGQVGPTITAVAPLSGNSGLTHTLTISGQNFLSPTQVSLVGQTHLSYAVSVTSVSTQVVQAIIPWTLPADLYDLELTNAGGLSTTLGNAFALYTPQPNTCFFDDFASGWGQWIRTGEWDIVTTDGQEAATDSPEASYLNAEPGLTRTTTITSRSFNLTTCPNPVLSFQHDYRLAIGPAQFQDWGRVEISFDQGQTWSSLASYTGGGSYEPATAMVIDEWSQAQWQTVTINLAEANLPTGSTTVQLRFNLIADAEGSDKGWLLDNVAVKGCSTQPCAPAPLSNVYLPVVIK